MPAFNKDGLKIYFPSDGSQLGNGGEYETDGLFRVIDIELNLANLTQTETVQSRIVFPKGKVLGRVEVIADTAAATGVAIDVGLVRQDSSETEIDYDGILEAFPTASMNVEGETTRMHAGDTYAGALVGKVASASYPAYITASATTSTAFTQGRIRLRLYWYKKTSTT